MQNKNDYLVFKFLFALVIISFFVAIFSYYSYSSLSDACNLDMLNTIVNIFLACSTLFAVLVAIIIPIEDRREYSRIELFQKRYEIYFDICQIIRKGFYQAAGNVDGEIKDEVLARLEQCKYLLENEDADTLFKIIRSTIVQTIESKGNVHSFEVYTSKKKNEELLKEIDGVFEKYLYIGHLGK